MDEMRVLTRGRSVLRRKGERRGDAGECTILREAGRCFGESMAVMAAVSSALLYVLRGGSANTVYGSVALYSRVSRSVVGGGRGK